MEAVAEAEVGDSPLARVRTLAEAGAAAGSEGTASGCSEAETTAKSSATTSGLVRARKAQPRHGRTSGFCPACARLP